VVVDIDFIEVQDILVEEENTREPLAPWRAKLGTRKSKKIIDVLLLA